MKTLDTIDYPKSEVGGMGVIVYEEGDLMRNDPQVVQKYVSTSVIMP